MPPLPGVCFSEIICEICGLKKTCRLLETPADFIPLTCSHALCVKCFEKYVGDSLDNKAVYEIPCPAKTNCGRPINYYTIEINFPQGSEIFEQRIIERMSLDRRPEKKEKPSKPADNNRMEIEEGQYENRKEMDSEDFIQKTYTKCPNCNIPIEKTRGCYTMRCESATCQKKTLFCYLCGMQLTQQTEKDHYAGNSFQKCKKLLQKNNE